MSLERVGHWVGVAANLGVLLGILVVAYQLRLNWEAMQQASNQQISSIATSAEVALMGDTGYEAYAKSIINPSDLTPGELVQLWTYMSIAQLNAMQVYMDYREGRVTEPVWQYSRDIFISYFNYPMGRAWFEESKQSTEGTAVYSFFDATQEALDESTPDTTRKLFLKMQERASKLRETGGVGT